VPKLAPLYNPNYRDFLKRCQDMYAETSKQKQARNEQDVIVVTLDQACLFIVVNLDKTLWVELLHAHCLLERCKLWYHPASSADKPVKNWIRMENMWLQVEGFGESMLKEIIDQIFAGEDKKEQIKMKEEIISKFVDYRKEIKDSFFDMVLLS
jgi:hypothetical protein